MIGRDEPMALVVRQGRAVKTVINLGYATLDGNEYNRLRVLAEKYGCDISIDTLDLAEVSDFAQLFREVETAIK